MKKHYIVYIILFLLAFVLTPIVWKYRIEHVTLKDDEKVFASSESPEEYMEKYVGSIEHEVEEEFAVSTSEVIQMSTSSLISSGAKNMYNKSVIVGAWKEIGPTKDAINCADWVGRVSNIVFPSKENKDTVFVCSHTGGLFYSINGGNNWTNAGTDKLLYKSGVSSVDVSNTDSDKIWYITTGNGHNNGTTLWSESFGVFRTVDAGKTWIPIGLDKDFVTDCDKKYQMNEVIHLPDKEGHLLVATTDGLFETDNALDGTTYGDPSKSPSFAPRIDDHCFDIEIIPSTTRVIVTSTSWYCSAENTSRKLVVYIYDWAAKEIIETIENDLFYYEVNPARIAAEISPIDPNLVFLLVDNSTKETPREGRLLRFYLNNTSSITDLGYLGFINPDALALSPTDKNTLWYGTCGGDQGDGVKKVSNAMAASPPLIFDSVGYNNWRDPMSEQNKTHVDINSIVYSPDGSEIWAGTDGGVCKSTNGGDTWQAMNNGLGIATINFMDVFPSNPAQVIHGDQDNGTTILRKENGDWISEKVAHGDGYECTFDYIDPNHYYYHTQASSRFYEVSPDLGSNYFYWGQFVLNSFNPNILYVSRGAEGLMSHTEATRGNHSGELWSQFPGVTDDTVWRVAVCPNPQWSDYIYVSLKGPEKNKIFKSTTGGGPSASEWTAITLPPEYKNYGFSKIIVDYYDPHHIWVGSGWTLFSVNTLTNDWKPIPYPGGYEQVVHDKENFGLYFCTKDGVYYLPNGGTEFTDLYEYGGKLPNVRVKDIKINYATGKIYAATYGRGVWAAPLVCNQLAYNLDLGSSSISDDFYQARNRITSYGTIGNNATVSMRAGNYIDFLPGFTTSYRTSLNAYVLPCGSFKSAISYTDNDEYDPDFSRGIIQQESIEPLGNAIETQSFNVYPNPNNGEFTIESANADQEYVVKIFSINGEEVKTITNLIGKSQIDLQFAPKGIYVVKVFSDISVLTKRVVVK